MNIKLDQVVTTLLAEPTLSAIFGTRIYWGEPVNEQAGVYLVLNTITQRYTEYDRYTRVEFRICANTENVTKKTLIDASDVMYTYLVDNGPSPVRTFGTYSAYKIVGGSEFVVARGEKNRNILVQDFIFYHAT